jgi:FKBP-type peptidyl-prolyl cis-trans isomerase FklB
MAQRAFPPLLLVPAALAVLLVLPVQAEDAAKPDDDSGSYSVGLLFGEQLHATGVGDVLSVPAMTQGLQDALAGKASTPQDRERIQQFMRAARETVAKRNAAAAAEVLARNAHEKGVRTTNSGLQYRVLVAGNAKAASPQPNDQVMVNYRGRLIDGTEFDSSYARGQPATFTPSGVIRGWQEALGMMKPGAKWQIWVPPELGYGDASRPPIPPNSLLIFEVELVSVRGPDAPRSPGS